MEQEFSSLGDIFKNKGAQPRKKPPAHPWQDLALEVITKLAVPNFKRNSVFKVCKDNPATVVRRALNDTLELCDSGAKWKYFFKVMAGETSTPTDLSKSQIQKLLAPHPKAPRKTRADRFF